MIRHFHYRKIGFLLVFLGYALTSMGTESMDLFEKKWATAQTYLEEEEMDKLLPLTKEMGALIKKNQPTPQAKIAYLLGEYWHYQEKWLKGIDYLDLAIKGLTKDSTTQLLLAEAYLVRGYCLHELEDFEETLSSYEQSLSLKKKVLGKDHIKVSNLYFNLGYIHQEKRDILSSYKAFHEGLGILQSIYKAENEKFADFYEELGFNQMLKGNFHSSTEYLKKALDIKIKIFGPNSDKLVFPYKYLGISYKENEDYNKAIIYFKQALQILEQQSEKGNFEKSMLNFHIGKSYLHLEEYTTAYIWLEKAIETDKQNKYLRPEIHHLKGKVTSKNGEILVAEKYFDQAILGFQNDLKNNKEYILSTYKSIIKHHLNLGNYEQAIVYINKSLALGKVFYKQRPHELFDFYKSKGKYFHYRGNQEKAMFYFSKAQNSIGGNINLEDANSFQLKKRIILNETYIDLLVGKKSKLTSSKALLQADSILSATVDLITYLTKNYREQSTKENFIKKFYEIFKKAVDVKYSLYESTKNSNYLKEAFLLSEQSKNLILLETLKNVAAFESAEVPVKIIEEENKLKTDITYLENRRFEENQQPKRNTQLIKALNRDIFTLKEKYEGLINKIEQEHPRYYELKFKPRIVSIADIQQKLITAEESIIEYFLADSSIYIFLLKKDTFQTFALPKAQDLEQKITQFRKSIYSYRPPITNSISNTNDRLIQQKNKLGLLLYQSLVEPLEEELTLKITIIADGVLGYLPFDALVTNLPKNEQKNNISNYLISKHIISFAHSVNWLNGLNNQKNTQFDQNFIGIAPLFKGTANNSEVSDFRLGLGPLKYNQIEVENIKNSIGGKVIKGVFATRHNFLEQLSKGQVLHLATHGKSNDDQGDYSYLAFAKPTQKTDNQFLYVKDLFNLKIPADLVVLSACETGLGEIKRGEGIVGIGKGFSYAGAKSIVTTLWRVSDNSTANFMPIFYKNLKKGLTKDVALWKAKKEFINTYRDAAHPFFWSGYVAYGNMKPIKFQHSNWSIQLITGLSFAFCLLSLILYLSFFKKQPI